MSASESPRGHLTDVQVRKKLLHQGAAFLNDAELLSILLGKGEGNVTAVELAERLLKKVDGNFMALGQFTLQQLRMTENLGIGRAAQVAAALELGRRFRVQATQTREIIETDSDVIEIFQPQLAGLTHEEFWALYLNSSNKIQEKVRISQGGVSGTVVDVRLVVKRALERLSSAIVLVHNHPSGNPTPSEQDQQITRQLYQAAALFDIRVIDHIIITAGTCHSFRRHGFFDVLDSDRK